MRVTLVSALLDLSGGSRVIATYARMLVDHQHHVTVVAPRRRPRTMRQKLRAFLGTGKWEREPTHGSHYDGLGLDVRIIDHRPLVATDVPDADVIVATWWETAEWINSLPASKGAKVYFVQGHEIFDAPNVERVRATYHMPFLKIVVSGWLQRIMLDEYGDADTLLVPNSVDHVVFNAPPREKQLVPTVGFLYSEGAVKSVEVAIEAIRRVKQRLPGVRVISFGTRAARNIEGIGDDFRFCLLPDSAQLRASYSACDVWICSSRTEGFGLPAMEAMACRTPVVSTRVGWPLDAIDTGRNGYLVPIGDVDAIVESVLHCFALDAASWRAMSEAAHQTAHAYNWRKSYQLFDAALQRARRSRREGVSLG